MRSLTNLGLHEELERHRGTWLLDPSGIHASLWGSSYFSLDGSHAGKTQQQTGFPCGFLSSSTFGLGKGCRNVLLMQLLPLNK